MFLARRLRKLSLALLATAGLPWAALAQEKAPSPETPRQDTTAKAVWLDLTTSLSLDTNLGLELEAGSSALRSQLDLAEDQGVVVTGVLPASPAEVAGIKANDVLLTLSDTPVGSVDVFFEKLGILSRGWKDAVGDKKPATLTLLRAGKKVTVELSAPTSDMSRLLLTANLAANLTQAGDDSQKYWIGVAVADVDATLRSQLSLPEGEGLVVTEVYPDLAGEKAGLKVHDVLLELHDKRLGTTETLRALVQELGPTGNSAIIKLLRRGKPATLSITPSEKNLQLGFVKADDALMLREFPYKLGRLEGNVMGLNFVTQNQAKQGLIYGVVPHSFAITSTVDANTLTNGLNVIGLTAAPQPTTLNVQPAPSVGANGTQMQELLNAIQQLSQKIEALEQAIKKPAESSGK